jgi:hydrogenase nickel incorporation protein HypB
MCKECGCGLPGEKPAGISAQHHEHDHEHGHTHEHEHEHEHGPGHHHGEAHDHAHSHPHTHEHGTAGHSHGEGSATRVVELHRAILEKNDRLAERNRGFFRARGLLVLNVVSSPGSGKTTFLRETLRRLTPRLKTGIIVGDLATDNDAQRLREAGSPVVQVTTGTVCHLEAEMVARAVQRLPLEGMELLIIENVGNLVCPASYDLGEELRVVLLSVTEGEDKPLKYPPMFQSADVVIISKSDLARACEYDQAAALANLHRVAPRARVFETSAKTGQGMDPWCSFLLEQQQQSKARDPLAF